MATTIYIKKPYKIKRIISLQLSSRKIVKYERFFFLLISIIGFSTMIFAIMPLIIWQLKTLPQLTAKIEDFPVPKREILSASADFSNVQVVKDPDGFSYFVTTNNSKDQNPQQERPSEFFLTIPKLKIKKALVKTDSLRFDKNRWLLVI